MVGNFGYINETLGNHPQQNSLLTVYCTVFDDVFNYYYDNFKMTKLDSDDTPWTVLSLQQ